MSLPSSALSGRQPRSSRVLVLPAQLPRVSSGHHWQIVLLQLAAQPSRPDSHYLVMRVQTCTAQESLKRARLARVEASERWARDISVRLTRARARIGARPV